MEFRMLRLGRFSSLLGVITPQRWLPVERTLLVSMYLIVLYRMMCLQRLDTTRRNFKSHKPDGWWKGGWSRRKRRKTWRRTQDVDFDPTKEGQESLSRKDHVYKKQRKNLCKEWCARGLPPLPKTTQTRGGLKEHPPNEDKISIKITPRVIKPTNSHSSHRLTSISVNLGGVFAVGEEGRPRTHWSPKWRREGASYLEVAKTPFSIHAHVQFPKCGHIMLMWSIK